MLVLYVGGRHGHFVHYCLEHGLRTKGPSVTALHVTHPRHVEGVHVPYLRIVYGQQGPISDDTWAAIEARLTAARSGTVSVEEVHLDA